ncbi:hypothetical protein DQP56_23625 [Mycolicibacter senuensis]|nr:hypothetical protein DQP56_23625 [Mycolicibacter senuensis]
MITQAGHAVQCRSSDERGAKVRLSPGVPTSVCIRAGTRACPGREEVRATLSPSDSSYPRSMFVSLDLGTAFTI